MKSSIRLLTTIYNDTLILTIGLIVLASILAPDHMVSQNLERLSMTKRLSQYGIVGHEAPELRVAKWINSSGNESGPQYLKDYQGKFIVIYGFQAWCPGCHSRGLPSLQKMVKALAKNENVVFLAVQTVFEGKHANTYERLKEIQEEYELEIPFGHDEGDFSTGNRSSLMFDYRTGGTPWFIFIDEENKVVFNDYHLNVKEAIRFLAKR